MPEICDNLGGGVSTMKDNDGKGLDGNRDCPQRVDVGEAQALDTVPSTLPEPESGAASLIEMSGKERFIKGGVQ